MKPDTNNSEQREQLLLTMQGHPSKKGGVPVGLFTNVYGALARLMRKSAERLTGETKNTGLDFVVAELSHNSPIRVGIEAAPSPSLPLLWDGDLARNTVVRTEQLFRDIDAGKGDDIPAAELELIEKMASPFSKERVSMMQIQRFNGRAYPPVEMTHRLVANLARLRQDEIQCHTTVTGMVELLDLRNRPIRLIIHPDIGEPVRCILLDSEDSDEAYEKARRAIGNRAAVSGEARYRPMPERPDIQQPHIIHTTPGEIEVFDRKEDQGSILQFQGAFPNITGGKPTLEYLRELRGED